MPEPLEIIALQSAPMVVVAQLHRHQITGQLSNNRMAAREAADSANIGATVATARAATAPGPSADSFDVDLIMDFPRHPGVREENEEINRVLSDVFIGRFVHDLRDGNLVLIALYADVFFWILKIVG